MTIKAGEEWGRPAGATEAVATVSGDAELAARLASDGTGPFRVTGGDLHRAVGEPGPDPVGRLLPVDALEIRLDDGPPRLAVAHLVARRSWWRGPVLAVCNTDFVGRWNAAPRAHPNDGRADVVEVDPAMPWRARWQAARRLPHGTHVPHPQITTRSVRTASFQFDRPVRVWIDGSPAGTARSVQIQVRPDACELLI